MRSLAMSMPSNENAVSLSYLGDSDVTLNNIGALIGGFFISLPGVFGVHPRRAPMCNQQWLGKLFGQPVGALLLAPAPF